MNRYHAGFLFAATALILYSAAEMRSGRITGQQEADRRTVETLRFALSCATAVASADYGEADNPRTISDVLFKSLSVMEEGRSVGNGRISPEDFYPYVPVMVCLQERYYYLGYYDGSAYRFDGRKPYTADCRSLAELPQDTILLLLEQEINGKLSVSHKNRGLPDTDYVVPDAVARNPESGTLLLVLENFPTVLDGYYYSGIFDGSGAVRGR